MIISTPKLLFVGFNPATLSRDALTGFLSSNPAFQNWITLLPGQIFVLSELAAAPAAGALRERFPSQLLFVTEIHATSSDGWLPQAIWDFLNNPKPATPEDIDSIIKRTFGI